MGILVPYFAFTHYLRKVQMKVMHLLCCGFNINLIKLCIKSVCVPMQGLTKSRTYAFVANNNVST